MSGAGGIVVETGVEGKGEDRVEGGGEKANGEEVEEIVGNCWARLTGVCWEGGTKGEVEINGTEGAKGVEEAEEAGGTRVGGIWAGSRCAWGVEWGVVCVREEYGEEEEEEEVVENKSEKELGVMRVEERPCDDRWATTEAREGSPEAIRNLTYINNKIALYL